jgi:MFS family permease
MSRLDNTTKIVLLTFFSHLYFYIHINTLYLQTRGLDLLKINSIEAIIIATIFFAEVPTGIIADRIGRKGSVVLALLCQTLGEVFYLFGKTYLAFVFIAIIAGVGFAFASGATEALVYDTLPEEDREAAMKKAMGRIGSARQLGFFLAPLVGGLIVSELVLSRFLIVIFLTALSVFIAFLISLTLKEPPIARDAKPLSSLYILKNGLGDLRHSRKLQHVALLTILTATFGGSLLTFSQPLFVEHKVSMFMIGVVFSVGSLLAAFTQHYAYLIEKVFGKRRGLFIATILPGLLYMLLALMTGGTAIWLLVVLLYGVNELKVPLYSAYQNALINSQNRATMLSLINMFSSLFVAVMALVYGAIATTSIPMAFMVIGLVIVTASVLLRADKLPTLVEP